MSETKHAGFRCFWIWTKIFFKTESCRWKEPQLTIDFFIVFTFFHRALNGVASKIIRSLQNARFNIRLKLLIQLLKKKRTTASILPLSKAAKQAGLGSEWEDTLEHQKGQRFTCWRKLDPGSERRPEDHRGTPGRNSENLEDLLDPNMAPASALLLCVLLIFSGEPSLANEEPSAMDLAEIEVFASVNQTSNSSAPDKPKITSVPIIIWLWYMVQDIYPVVLCILICWLCKVCESWLVLDKTVCF